MQRIGKMSVGPKGDREIEFTRPFQAPRRKVWDALTIPALIKQWLGAMDGWTFPVCEVDLKVGGKYRYLWKNANGTEMGMGGTFQEVTPHDRIVSAERFDDPWYPGDAIVTQELTDAAGGTMLTMTIRYETTAARDGVLAGPAASGVGVSFDALAKLLEQ